MANTLRLSRFNKFYGGITVDDRSRAEGVFLNMEELDPFKSRSYIQPQTIFEVDGDIMDQKIAGYTYDDNDTGYLIAKSLDGDAEIFDVSSVSTTTPGSWSSTFESAEDFNEVSPVIWHKEAGGDEYLYYVTGTNDLRRVDIPSYSADASEDTLTDIGTSYPRIPMIRTNDELYIGNGSYIANVDDSGTSIDQFAQIYPEWECVSFTRSSNLLAILAKSTKIGENRSKVFFWDFSQNPDSMIDEVDIPMGGPQIILNHNETLRVICAKNGELRAYAIDGRRAILTHTLYDVIEETSTQAVVPDASKFIKDNIMYFAVNKTDKTGLYAIGQVDAQAPAALILAKRFHTTDYSNHTAYSASAIGPNWFAGFDDDGTARAMKLEDLNFPTYSSNAIYESIWFDASNPELSKQWQGFILNTSPMTANLAIDIDARVDNAAAYSSPSPTSAALYPMDADNDQVDSGGTANTNWVRTWTNFVGRTLQFKLTFTSSTTTFPKLYQISLLHRDGVLENL